MKTVSNQPLDPIAKGSSVTGNDKHFNQIAKDYEKSYNTWEPIHRQIEAYVHPLIMGRRVLDVGNGGFFPYDITQAAQVQVLDISAAMLDRIQIPNIIKIVGDARDLSPIADHSVDLILYSLCLHHIHGHNLAESKSILDQIFTAAKQKLCQGGHLLVVEPCLSQALFILESLLFPLTRALLAFKKIPMIFFYSPALLRERLGAHFPNVGTSEFAFEGWVDPLGGSFPGLIKIPARLCPTRYFLFDATL